MKFDVEKVREEILNAEPGTKFYFGCDSRKYQRKKSNEWWCSYATVVIVHIAGKHGCRVYGRIDKERVYGSMKMRLLNEAYKATEMVLLFKEDLEDKDFEIHLDINSDPKEGSHVALKEAAGYILGMTGVRPLFKPHAFGASCAADLFEGKSKKVSKRKYNRYLSKSHNKNVKSNNKRKNVA